MSPGEIRRWRVDDKLAGFAGFLAAGRSHYRLSRTRGLGAVRSLPVHHGYS
jgi:hypothetical protein